VYWSDVPSSWLLTTAALLGLLFGSFLNVVVYRVPREQNIAFPPSTCPACGARIRAYDNVPVLSWLWLRGKARCCGASISPRYPLIEVLGGLLSVFLMQYQISLSAVDRPLWELMACFAVELLWGLSLVAALFIDLEFMILPDTITLGGTLVGIAVSGLRGVGYVPSIVGAAIAFFAVWLPFDFFYRLIRGRQGMGLGDAKLLMMLGAWLGWGGALFALMAGAVQGTLFALSAFLTQGKLEEPAAVKAEREELRRELEALAPEQRAELEAEFKEDILFTDPDGSLGGARIPFGPFLILSAFEYFFFSDVIQAYFLEWLWQA
jgi:leader peptidase (prepilin peptidase) / N-methyltransferase